MPALDACADLSPRAPWYRVREWCDHYGIDLEWLWPVLRHANGMLEQHREKMNKAKRANAPRNRPNPRH
jgi:hypothetical protein